MPASPAHGRMGERAKTCVDLNADLGEVYGAYACGGDAAILDLVTSANVASRSALRRSSGVSARHGITDGKTHGALGTIAAEERSVASAVAPAARTVDPNLALLAIALGAQAAPDSAVRRCPWMRPRLAEGQATVHS